MGLPSTALVVVALTGMAIAQPSLASSPEGPGEPQPDRPTQAEALRLEQGSAQWWQGFEDAHLDALVEAGLSQNLDVRAAELRVAESEAAITQQRAPLLPRVSWDSTINLGPTASLGFQFGGLPSGGDPNAEPPPDVYWTGSSVLNVSLELDLTGRRVLDLRASRDDRSAARAEHASSQVTIASSITQAYYDLVAARARLRVVDEQIATVEALVELTQQRLADGGARATDLLQQRQQLASTQTLRPQAQAQVRAFSQQLAVLLAESPDTQHESADALPELLLAAGAEDAELALDRRPDMVAAEHRVRAAERREKVARREFAPSLSVSANAGIQAFAISEVSDQWYWGAGASLSVPIFAGGQRIGALRQREAQTASSRNEVARVRLEAQRQVADARAAQGERLAIVEASLAELEVAEQTYLALRERYFEGDADVLNLLSALTSRQQAELNLITARRDLITAHIDLQRALAPATT
ncbi:hypothetical protein PPSIR1_18872 [Plesiocystis pacifica SIR-1]|uniref:Outer membrane efflux protein n=1 Tax=Plesiocystis pacifica SIR-1 TaxID=391625 RepID=A6GBJ0_9BACT|nr:TolC family protein [Plesiocystis pacifica]EDM76794.1 hypothetical protein PPSIR1_18872 [Plesiocystis pacifica SIR-1]